MTFGSLGRTLSFSGSNMDDNTFAPAISDAPDGGIVGVDKLDQGKWILQAANSYSGPTRVAGGSLIINGLQSGAGLTAVESAGLLGGSGGVGGNLEVAGIVAPGDQGAGTFTVGGDAAFSSSATLAIELGGLTAGTEHDALSIGGELDVTDATLNVSLTSGFQPSGGNVFDVLDFGSVVGTFGTISLPGDNADWDTSQLLVDGTLRFLGGATVDGDFNDDGIYDCMDIDALTGEIAGNTNDAAFDLTGDGFVDVADRDAWLAEAGAENLASGNAYLLGDANLDGVVDVSDFNIWNNGKFTAVAAWCSGDFNVDGSVDVSDFNIWNTNKFLSADTLAVPEPGTFGILLLGIGLYTVRHRRDAER